MEIAGFTATTPIKHNDLTANTLLQVTRSQGGKTLKQAIIGQIATPTFFPGEVNKPVAGILTLRKGSG